MFKSWRIAFITRNYSSSIENVPLRNIRRKTEALKVNFFYINLFEYKLIVGIEQVCVRY